MESSRTSGCPLFPPFFPFSIRTMVLLFTTFVSAQSADSVKLLKASYIEIDFPGASIIEVHGVNRVVVTRNRLVKPGGSLRNIVLDYLAAFHHKVDAF